MFHHSTFVPPRCLVGTAMLLLLHVYCSALVRDDDQSTKSRRNLGESDDYEALVAGVFIGCCLAVALLLMGCCLVDCRRERQAEKEEEKEREMEETERYDGSNGTILVELPPGFCTHAGLSSSVLMVEPSSLGDDEEAARGAEPWPLGTDGEEQRVEASSPS